MSILDDNTNQCDNCGQSFPAGGGLSGPVEGLFHDYCLTCAEQMGATNCGGCGELMDWGSLNDQYLCSSCEPKLDPVHPSFRRTP